MRIRLGSTWVAAHPDYPPDVWTCDALPAWLPARTGDWLELAGAERAGFEDGENAGLALSFSVTRVFATLREAADFQVRLHSTTPPHPWNGAGLVRYDREDGGTVDLNLGECVLQLTKPVEVLGALTLRMSYQLHLGVVGAQPVLTDPVNPDQDDEIGYGDYYGGGGS